jgi:hypothetical protein
MLMLLAKASGQAIVCFTSSRYQFDYRLQLGTAESRADRTVPNLLQSIRRCSCCFLFCSLFYVVPSSLSFSLVFIFLVPHQ